MSFEAYMELSEDSGSSHKFYEVKIEGTQVVIRYGRIGTDGTSSSQSFDNEAEARKFADKKIKEKQKKGYETAVKGVRQKRSITRRQIESKPSAAKKSPILWRFRSGAAAFGIFIDEKHCWLGNENGTVFKLNHQGEVLAQYQLPDGVKCIVGDQGWVYVGCDDGNVYDLTGKIPRLAYQISEDIDIFWLDIANGLLCVSDRKGKLNVINYEDEQQFEWSGGGDGAWMVRCDTVGRVFYGDSAGVSCVYGYDGTTVWKNKTRAVLFGWQEKNKVFASTAEGKIHSFSKEGALLQTYQADSAVFSCAAYQDGLYVFAGDSSSSLYCFNEAGERLWKLATGCGSAYSMQYFQEKVYIVTTDGSLACIDASESAILNAQNGVLPATAELKAPARTAEIVTTTELEVVSDESKGVVLTCVKEGGKLRVKVVSQGYHPDWFVQFPRNLRQEGAFYLADSVEEAAQGGFYRAHGNIYRLNKA
jgi:predicted DNA-binding WGR domain protein